MGAAMAAGDEEPLITLSQINGVHADFQAIIASKALRMVMARIEVSKKDVEALERGIEIFEANDVDLPAFSGDKRKQWIKDLKKALKKANKKKDKKKKKNKD